MAITIQSVVIKDRFTNEAQINGVRATGTGTARAPSVGVTTGTLGWNLTTTNTGLSGVGINRATLPVYSGTPTNGSTISNVKITNSLDLSGLTNVTLDRVWVQIADYNRAVIIGPGTTIKDSDIDGSLMPGGERFGISSPPSFGTNWDYNILRCNITGISIGIYLDSAGSTGNGLVSETYIHSMISTLGAHIDGLTRRVGTAPLLVTGCRIANDYSDGGGSHATGSIFLATTYGTIGGVTLKDSYFEGNGNNIEFDSNGPGVTSAVNNVRLRSTEYGTVEVSGTITFTDWTDVYLYDAAQPNAAGAVVPHP